MFFIKWRNKKVQTNLIFIIIQNNFPRKNFGYGDFFRFFLTKKLHPTENDLYVAIKERKLLKKNEKKNEESSDDDSDKTFEEYFSSSDESSDEILHESSEETECKA